MSRATRSGLRAGGVRGSQDRLRVQAHLRDGGAVFLELPKYSAGPRPLSLVDKWALFFREAKNWDVIPEVLSEGPFREALEIARVANFSPSEWDAYERSKMAEQDARGALTVARAEGKAEGELGAAARALLTILRVRAIAVPESAHARISAQRDLPTLERWLERAATASTLAAVFDDAT